jgi:hypothetical protein
MAIQEAFTGTRGITVGDGEWSLTQNAAGPGAETDDGLFQAVLDICDIADGEQLRLRAYEKCRSGDTQRKVWEADFTDNFASCLIYTPPMILLHGWDFTAQTLIGTITVNWSLRSLAQTVTERVTGSEAVSTTEWSLATDSSWSSADAQTSDGHYQLFLDVNDMVQADVLQIRAYEIARSGDTQRLAYEAFLGGPQANPMWVGPTLCGMHGWDWSLDAIAGTITCLWSIRTVGS